MVLPRMQEKLNPSMNFYKVAPEDSVKDRARISLTLSRRVSNLLQQATKVTRHASTGSRNSERSILSEPAVDYGMAERYNQQLYPNAMSLRVSRRSVCRSISPEYADINSWSEDLISAFDRRWSKECGQSY
jgi:hypothetical protein